MAKLKVKQVKKFICNTCHGNGYIRVATGDTSLDFRDNSQVHQCWDCDSSGELEIVEPTFEELEKMSEQKTRLQ